MYGFLRNLSTGVFLRGCAWMSVTDNNTENYEVVLWELSWLPGNKLARFSAAETLEPAPVNLENVTQKLHSMKTPPGKTQSRRVSQCPLSFTNFRIVRIFPLDSMLQLFIWNIPKNNILKFGA